MTYSQCSKLSFNDLDEFVNKSFEELCTCEEIFRNQIVIETYIENVQQNFEKLQRLFLDTTSLQCNQQFLENGLNYLDFALHELDKGISCFEKNFCGPEYFTPKDVAREDLYHFLLCVISKIANIGSMVEEINSEVKEIKKNVKSDHTEKLVQLMMKHLNLLEDIENKTLWLKEEVQKILFLEMVIMKRFNLKLKQC